MKKATILLLSLTLGQVAVSQENVAQQNVAQQGVAQDEIKKWCDDSGKKVRYAAKPAPGYSPCGEVATEKLCDPSGKRYIGVGKPSAVYKDCSLGQRISVIRHGPPLEAVPTSGASNLTRSSDMEQADIDRTANGKKAAKEIQRTQGGTLAEELTDFISKVDKMGK